MTVPPFVVLGAKGMLGRAWVELLQREGRAFSAADRSRIDIANPKSLEQGIVEGTRVVVNCAAWANVDGAEEHEDEASIVNGTAVGLIAERCRQVGATLIHYGTDYVFDGLGTEPYAVSGRIAPLNAYGRGKALGEKLLQDSGADYLLIRTSWVYAPWGKNFVRTMARLSTEKQELRVVDDQRGRPTSAEGLALQSLRLLSRDKRGIFHVTDSGECSWYEFAEFVVSLSVPRAVSRGLCSAEHRCVVHPCSSSEFPTKAVRPRSSVLSLVETQDAIGPAPHWKDAVRDTVERLEPLA